jgi:lysyl-tRNA synthetase class 1
LGDVLKVYTPELTRYLFAGTRPNTEFTISFDLDVIKIYEDYDKTERIAWKLEPAKDDATYRWERRIYELSQPATDADGKTPLTHMVPPFQIPFRHFCSLIQIADGDVEKTLEALGGSGDNRPTPEQIPSLRARAQCAKYWVENCAPGEFRFRLRPAGEDVDLSAPERAAIQLLRDNVISRIESFADDKPCAEAIYGTAKEAGLEGKEMFRAAYQVLIGKDQGPRLASFLRSIDKQRLLDILRAY